MLDRARRERPRGPQVWHSDDNSGSFISQVESSVQGPPPHIVEKEDVQHQILFVRYNEVLARLGSTTVPGMMLLRLQICPPQTQHILITRTVYINRAHLVGKKERNN